MFAECGFQRSDERVAFFVEFLDVRQYKIRTAATEDSLGLVADSAILEEPFDVIFERKASTTFPRLCRAEEYGVQLGETANEVGNWIATTLKK